MVKQQSNQKPKKMSKVEKIPNVAGNGRFEVRLTKTVNYFDYIYRTFNKVEADHATDS